MHALLAAFGCAAITHVHQVRVWPALLVCPLSVRPSLAIRAARMGRLDGCGRAQAPRQLLAGAVCGVACLILCASASHAARWKQDAGSIIAAASGGQSAFGSAISGEK